MNKSKTDAVFDVRTKDGYVVRVKAMAISDKRIQAGQHKGIRQIMEALIIEAATDRTIGEFTKIMLSGDLAKKISYACKKIQPKGRIEIRKSEILVMGEPEEIPEIVEVAGEDAPKPDPVEEEEAEEETEEDEAEEEAKEEAKESEETKEAE